MFRAEDAASAALKSARHRAIRFTAALVLAVLFMPLRPAEASQIGCTNPSRDCLIAVASTYVEALKNRDASAVPLASYARRTENGLVTGTNAREIRDAIEHGLSALTVLDVRDVRWSADEKTGDAVAFYMLDSGPILHTASVWVGARLRVLNGEITEIEVVFWTVPGPFPARSPW